jgi:hypothetical protein
MSLKPKPGRTLGRPEGRSLQPVVLIAFRKMGTPTHEDASNTNDVKETIADYRAEMASSDACCVAHAHGHGNLGASNMATNSKPNSTIESPKQPENNSEYKYAHYDFMYKL